MTPPAPPPPAPPAVVETVTVSAARLAPAMNQKLFSVITIKRVALDDQPRLDQALGQVPGLSLFRRTSSLSTNPTTEGVSMRAVAPSAAGRALVTLDGVPQSDPFGGWVIWSNLPSEAIGGISVVRGAGAGPYGAGALTGTIAMTERTLAPGDWSLDAAGGEIGYEHAAGVGDVAIGPGDLFVSASGEHSSGWYPVSAGRGAADRQVNLDDRQVSARYDVDVLGGVMAARVSGYGQSQGTGVVGGFARANGTSESLSWARQPTATTLGADLQVWARQSGFSQMATSEAVGHATATPANLQYATPADGVGVNGALRRATQTWSWEAGFDGRTAEGETHELFTYVAGAFTKRRIAGGKDGIIGLYAEGSASQGDWLFTGGVRVDAWRDWAGKLRETVIATNVATVNNQYSGRGGVVPTARAAARRDLGDGLYARAAAYAGFRPPTLNELYRPFRVGNLTTNANPALQPEKLYGGEAGLGRDYAHGSVDADVFVNQLVDPIINVTTGVNVQQRQNVPRIDAVGFEIQATHRLLDDRLVLRAAASATDARVNGGVAAPVLTGRRPAQAPIWTATAGVDWRVTEKLILSADARYESRRFDDDLNIHPLSAATTADARATWRLTRQADLFVDTQNLFGVRVPTAVGTDGVTSYGAPRIVSVGITLRR